MMNNQTTTWPLGWVRFNSVGLASGLAVSMVVSTLMGVNALQAASINQTATLPNAQLEWKGIVEAAPSGGSVGTWTIGGLGFVADGNTQFDEANGALGIGVCADVYYAESNGQNVALSIESDADPTCSAESGTEAEEGAEEGADADSSGNEGEGTEDGDANSDENDNENGDENGETEDENETYGTIAGMPAGSLIGDWIIDGVTYVSTSATKFEEEHGPLAPGVTVEVEFEVVNGVNQLLEIESHPETGEGPTNRTGVIQSTGSAVTAASIRSANISVASIRAAGSWQIGDVTYTVASTTQLDESNGTLVVGATAAVNSFTATDGREIATRISTIGSTTQSVSLFLPMVAGF